MEAYWMTLGQSLSLSLTNFTGLLWGRNGEWGTCAGLPSLWGLFQLGGRKGRGDKGQLPASQCIDNVTLSTTGKWCPCTTGDTLAFTDVYALLQGRPIETRSFQWWLLMFLMPFPAKCCCLRVGSNHFLLTRILTKEVDLCGLEISSYYCFMDILRELKLVFYAVGMLMVCFSFLVLFFILMIYDNFFGWFCGGPFPLHAA